MPWEHTKPLGRSVPCNGELVRYWRHARGWTQGQLASVSGYSERLIRKAEAGQPLHPDTLEILAESLSAADSEVTPEDLAAFPRQMAQFILARYRDRERQLVAAVSKYLNPQMNCLVAGDPRQIPFAGMHHSIDGFDRFWGQFFSVLDRPDKTAFRPAFIADGNIVVARGHETIRQIGSDVSASSWAIVRFVFSRGRLVLFEDLYDTQATVNYLAANSR